MIDFSDHLPWIGANSAIFDAVQCPGLFIKGGESRKLLPMPKRFRGANLTSVNLRFCDFQGADMRNAAMKGGVFTGSMFRGADLRGADLRGADLQGCDLRDARLDGCDLRCAVLWDTSPILVGYSGWGPQRVAHHWPVGVRVVPLFGAAPQDAEILAYYEQFKTSGVVAITTGCVEEEGRNEQGIGYPVKDMLGGTIQRQVTRCHGWVGELHAAMLSGASLVEAKLQAVDLRCLNCNNVDFTGADATNADFTGTTIDGACFQGTELARVLGIAGLHDSMAGVSLGKITSTTPQPVQAPKGEVFKSFESASPSEGFSFSLINDEQ
eukprot:TRINITY_DN4444_c0_g1_i2.p1 TRINITY_DN4444_c0_g1~~TRINITY_DN4444_c0_g1_i2.p1  ORF type:complete len:324 (-),score=32.71 TRINITY_DN4444_c0_g1_i2:61-1032(-)